jgi:hypothetical protein
MAATTAAGRMAMKTYKVRMTFQVNIRRYATVKAKDEDEAEEMACGLDLDEWGDEEFHAIPDSPLPLIEVVK